MLVVFIVVSLVFLVTLFWKWHVDRVGKSCPQFVLLALGGLKRNDSTWGWPEKTKTTGINKVYKKTFVNKKKMDNNLALERTRTDDKTGT